MVKFDTGYDDGFPDDPKDWEKDIETWKSGSLDYGESEDLVCEDIEGELFNGAFNKPLGEIYSFDPFNYDKVGDVLRDGPLGGISIHSIFDPLECYSVSLGAMLDFLFEDKVINKRMINRNGLDIAVYELNSSL